MELEETQISEINASSTSFCGFDELEIPGCVHCEMKFPNKVMSYSELTFVLTDFDHIFTSSCSFALAHFDR